MIKVINRIRVHALNSSPFVQICEEMDAEHPSEPMASQLVGEDLYTEMRWLSEGRLLANSHHWQHISVTQSESINLFNLFEELSPPSQERTTVFSWQTK